MRIDGISSLEKEGGKRISARISWDDCCREPYELYIETGAEFGRSLQPDPHAFLIASIIPAMHYGEKRIIIDEPICPEILDGLNKVMQVLASWNRNKGMKPVAIETNGHASPEPKEGRRSAFFYSGGIDCFATLRNNRLCYPPDHPRYFKDGFLVFGFEQDNKETFEHLLRSSLRVGQEADFTLIPVKTNMYLVFKDDDAKTRYRFWNMEYGGAALAAIAHAFSDRVDDVSIAANCDAVQLGPWGTHPIIDPNFSNRRISVRHDGVSLSRLEKVRLIAEWEVALRNIRVCNQASRYSEEMVNCGNCEKCIRTMLELMAVGKLKETACFPKSDVTAELVASRARIGNDFVRSFYMAVMPSLKEQGRTDLIHVIGSAVREYDRRDSVWRCRIGRCRQKLGRLFATAVGKGRGHPEQCS